MRRRADESINVQSTGDHSRVHARRAYGAALARWSHSQRGGQKRTSDVLNSEEGGSFGAF
jgi:hypothetical protein